MLENQSEYIYELLKEEMADQLDVDEYTRKISQADFRLASSLLSQNRVVLTGLDEHGGFTGEVNHREKIIAGAGKLTRDGQLILAKDDRVAEKNPYNLAMVLSLLHGIGRKKKTGNLKKILKKGPAWLNHKYRLNLEITSEKFDEDKSFFKTIEEQQAFWALQDMAISARVDISADILVHHLCAIYGEARFGVKVAGMEALLNRIKSSKKEELSIAAKPSQREIIGHYKVRRKGQGVLSYDILLSSNDGISGSCSCKDFQKNTLRFCKHLATIFNYFYQNEKRRKKFLRVKVVPDRPSLCWLPQTGLKKLVNPVDGIQLFRTGLERQKRHEKLAGFFKPSTGNGAGQVLKKGADNLELKSKRLQELKKAIVRTSRSIWVDPVIMPLLNKEIEALHWPIIYQKRKKELVAAFKNFKIELYHYQKEGVCKALECGKFLLGDDMGLGKTIQGIAWAEALLQNKIVRKVIIICPAALKAQWMHEWHQVYSRDIKIIEGNPSERMKAYQSKAKVFILNYELLLRDLDELLKLAPDAIILDEAQRIKNYATQTAQAVKSLRPPFRMILTGTPMENRIQELSSLMDWINDSAIGPTWRLDSELKIEGDGEGSGPKGVQGLDLLRQRISPYFLRRIRSEVLKDLPPRTDTPLLLPFSDEQREIHDDIARKLARLVAISKVRPLNPQERIRLMSYLTQMRIVSNALAQYNYVELWPSLKNDFNPAKRIPHLSSPKLGEFRNLIEGLLPQKNIKIVVFSQWKRMLHLAHWAIQDILKEQEMEAVFFTGGESQRRRIENIVRFHDDPSVRVFLATDAGGVGLNLQKAATICINLELPWNPAVLEQRIGRIYRIGQDHPIQVFNLITNNSIEERITKLVGQKKAVFDALFDDQADQVVFDEDANFYKQVQNVIQDLNVEPRGAIEEAEDEKSFEIDDAATSVCDDVIDDGDFTKREDGDAVANQISDAPLTSGSLINAFENIKVEHSPSGALKIEASGESAKILASMFKGMANLFEKSSL